MTDLQFKASDQVSTNKKIALFTDTEEDGITMGKIWERKAPAMGYDIAYHAEFPVGTTDFGSFIAKAKASGAEIVVAQMLPPDSFALWKQMKALSFVPKIAYCEKGAAQGGFQKALGPLAEGTATTNFYKPSTDPVAQQLTAKYGKKYGEALDLSSIVIAYSAAQVLTDAIERADSTDPNKVNKAIGETSGLYPIGFKISFDEDNSFAVDPSTVQWRGRDAVQVYPAGNGATSFKSPVAGLK